MSYTWKMYSVGQVSRAVGVSNTSVRNWSGDFADFLSSGANPGPGYQRQYTHDDLLVFSTIAVLRGQMVDAAEIHKRLASGERLEPTHPPEDETAEDEQAPDNPGRVLAAVSALEMALTTQQNRIGILERRNDELTERLLESERARATAETEAAMLRERYEQSHERGRMSFREWWASRRR